MTERFEGVVISHAVVIGEVTHTIQHYFSKSFNCKYCKLLEKEKIFGEDKKIILERITRG